MRSCVELGIRWVIICWNDERSNKSTKKNYTMLHSRTMPRESIEVNSHLVVVVNRLFCFLLACYICCLFQSQSSAAILAHHKSNSNPRPTKPNGFQLFDESNKQQQQKMVDMKETSHTRSVLLLLLRYSFWLQ